MKNLKKLEEKIRELRKQNIEKTKSLVEIQISPGLIDFLVLRKSCLKDKNSWLTL